MACRYSSAIKRAVYMTSVCKFPRTSSSPSKRRPLHYMCCCGLCSAAMVDLQGNVMHALGKRLVSLVPLPPSVSTRVEHAVSAGVDIVRSCPVSPCATVCRRWTAMRGRCCPHQHGPAASFGVRPRHVHGRWRRSETHSAFAVCIFSRALQRVRSSLPFNPDYRRRHAT